METEKTTPTYNKLKPGVPTVCGLQAIKGMVKIKGFHGVSKFHEGKEVHEPDTFGFRFVFRAKTDTNAFASEELKATPGEKGKLHRRVQGMCPASLGKLTKAEMAAIMVELVNHWYLVTVDHKPMRNGDVWQNIVTVAALPPELAPSMTPHEFFDSLGGVKVLPAENSKEHYLETFLATQAVFDGKPIPAAKVATGTKTGFETMSDAGPGSVYYYDITNVAPHMLEKAEVLLKKAGGAQVGPFEWETPTTIEPLVKYKKEKPKTDFDKDDLGDGF